MSLLHGKPTARRHSRVTYELPTLQVTPEHLHDLRDHVISGPDDQPLSAGSCGHRENPKTRFRDVRSISSTTPLRQAAVVREVPLKR
jgi:hypothetical protein